MTTRAALLLLVLGIASIFASLAVYSAWYEPDDVLAARERAAADRDLGEMIEREREGN